MDNLSKFAERLNGLIIEIGKSDKQVAEIVGVHRTTIGKYLSGKDFPSTVILIKLADLFNCSTDYLVGKIENESSQKFKQCPPFSEQINFLLNHFDISKYRLAKEADIPESIIYQWRDGKYVPTVPNLIKLSQYFDCSIDFILGREI